MSKVLGKTAKTSFIQRTATGEVMMSTVTPRQMLIFRIQEKLLDLIISQLQAVVSLIDDGPGTHNVEHLCEP